MIHRLFQLEIIHLLRPTDKEGYVNEQQARDEHNRGHSTQLDDIGHRLIVCLFEKQLFYRDESSGIICNNSDEMIVSNDHK
jgi:hypothetical protein